MSVRIDLRIFEQLLTISKSYRDPFMSHDIT